jgi:phosphatidylglycerol:prolipoprotein diacylglycerol transferase
MRQVLFVIPGTGIKLFGYGLMLCAAFIGSILLAAWRARRERLDPETVYDFAFWVFVGGLIGARLFYVVQYWGTQITSVLDIFRIWKGGIVLYGSIMGGAAAFFLYWWLRRFPLRPMLDVIAPSLALGIALGRLGCFLNGCCYGDRCDLPWAVSFPGPREGVPGAPTLALHGSPPWADQVRSGLIDPNRAWSLPVHPTQLYSTIDGLILVLLLSAYYPIRRRDGEVMALLMVTYPISRFLIEWLRNDERVFLAGMTISQSISVALLAAGLAFWAYLARLPRGRHADTAAEPVPADDRALVTGV